MDWAITDLFRPLEEFAYLSYIQLFVFVNYLKSL